METELIRIFDEQHIEIGIATRSEVHKVGYWHETFHCWIVEDEFIYLQLRSPFKKDFSNLFDITAAGHLLAYESVEDGVRELNEELGLTIGYDELTSLGVVKDSIENGELVDNEFCHLFLYRAQDMINKCRLQHEEVSGLVKAKFREFSQLILGKIESIHVNGFEIDSLGNKIGITKMISLIDIVPHEENYLKTVIDLIIRTQEE